MFRYLIFAAATVVAAATPAVAGEGCGLTACQAGQTVIAEADAMDLCDTLADLKDFFAKSVDCEGGGLTGQAANPQACRQKQAMYAGGACVHVSRGPSYVVITGGDVHQDMQISPVDDRSRTYWTDPGSLQSTN